MTLKEKIIHELENTKVENIDKMLQYMEQNHYYECRSSSHNHWKGGASQHMWAVYLIAKAIRDRDKRRKKRNIAQYATDEKLAIVCLLHDLCDMDVKVYMNGKIVGGHGYKSYCIMEMMNVGTEAEKNAVRNHMHSDCQHHLTTQQEIDEYNALHSLVHDADHIASGTAWNSTRFKEKRTQHHGVVTEDNSYLRAVAMDRSVQAGSYHMYVDEKYELREFKNFNRSLIRWNSCENVICGLNNDSIEVFIDANQDVISSAHKHFMKTGERLCIVVGVSQNVPKDKDTRLRRRWIDEQDILICSNILNSFYEGKKCEEKDGRFRYEFTMRDEIKKQYQIISQQKGGIYLPGVKMIRDGSGRGFPFVEPWDVDLLLVPDKKFPMFAIQTPAVLM